MNSQSDDDSFSFKPRVSESEAETIEWKDNGVSEGKASISNVSVSLSEELRAIGAIISTFVIFFTELIWLGLALPMCQTKSPYSSRYEQLTS